MEKRRELTRRFFKFDVTGMSSGVPGVVGDREDRLCSVEDIILDAVASISLSMRILRERKREDF